jgi:hypothetical protein
MELRSLVATMVLLSETPRFVGDDESVKYVEWKHSYNVIHPVHSCETLLSNQNNLFWNLAINISFCRTNIYSKPKVLIFETKGFDIPCMA